MAAGGIVSGGCAPKLSPWGGRERRDSVRPEGIRVPRYLAAGGNTTYIGDKKRTGVRPNPPVPPFTKGGRRGDFGQRGARPAYAKRSAAGRGDFTRLTADVNGIDASGEVTSGYRALSLARERTRTAGLPETEEGNKTWRYSSTA